jgi:hypothetical protein
MSDPVFTVTVNFEDGVHLPHTVVTVVSYDGNTYTATNGPEALAVYAAIKAFVAAAKNAD